MNAPRQGFSLGFHFGQGLFIPFINSHGGKQFIVIQISEQRLVGFQTIGQESALFEQGGGRFGVVPEAFLGNDAFQFLETVCFAFYVKDSLRGG